METIHTSIRCTDAMTPALRSIVRSMNMTISSFEAMQRASHHAVDTAGIQTARNELARAETQLNRMEQEINNAGKKQQKFNIRLSDGKTQAAGLANMIQRVVATYTGIQGGKKIIELSDTFASTSARLANINDGLRTQQELQMDIYAAAMRSHGAYQDMASVVSRLGLLAGKAFKDNEELIYFTETLQKAFKVSGASQSESSAAMYQLTQAMASGRLQGDEFRSIIENAPLLANSIESYLKSTGIKGTLKDWSSEGMITADVIKRSLFDAADEIEAKYRTMPKTFGDVWNEITNTAAMVFSPILQRMNDMLNAAMDTDQISGLAETFHQGAIYVSNFLSQAQLLWQSATPLIGTIKQEFAGLFGYIFSTNGLMGDFTNAMIKITRNRGVQQFFSTLGKGALMAAQSVGWVVRSVGSLTNLFGGALPIFAGAIIALTTFRMINGTFLPIAQSVGTAIFVMANHTKLFANTTNSAKVAQKGLNAVLKANPYMFVATAIMTVVAALASLVAGITAVNKAAGLASSNMTVGGVSREAIQRSKKTGRSASTEQAILNNQKQQQEIEKTQRDIIAKNKKKIAQLEDPSSTYYQYKYLEKDEAMAEAHGGRKLREAKAAISEAEATIRNSVVELVYSGHELAELDQTSKAIQSELDGLSKEEYKFDLDTPTIAAIKDDTGKIADSIDLSTEYLELLKDMAEREAINKFTTVPLYLDARSTNNVSSDLDLDGMVAYINGKLWEGINTAAEGAHI